LECFGGERKYVAAGVMCVAWEDASAARAVQCGVVKNVESKDQE